MAAAGEQVAQLEQRGVGRERVERACAGGERVVESLPDALDAALAAGAGPLYVLPTYTALLELRELLAARGQAEEYWR